MKQLSVRATPNDLDIFSEIDGDAHIAVYRDSAMSTKEIFNAVERADELAAALERTMSSLQYPNETTPEEIYFAIAQAKSALAAYRGTK